MIEPIPFGDRVLIKLEPKESVMGPLELPATAAQRSWPAKVIAVGPECKHIKSGDDILLSFYTGIVIQIYENHWLDNSVRMIREEEALSLFKRS